MTDKDFNLNFMQAMVGILKQYKTDKEKEGFIPTIELLIEDLSNLINRETL